LTAERDTLSIKLSQTTTTTTTTTAAAENDKVDEKHDSDADVERLTNELSELQRVSCCCCCCC
jgi:hypothetical protein